MLITASQILSQSFDLYKKHWKLVLTYIGSILLFCFIYAILILGLRSIYFVVSHIFSWQVFVVLSMLLSGALILLAVWVITWVITAFLTQLKNSLENKPTTTFITLLKQTRPLVWSVVLVNVLVGLIVFGGSLLVIFPGIIFAVWYYFAMHERIFSGKKGLSALEASKQLVIGRWWKILWRIIVPPLAIIVPLAILETIILKITEFSGPVASILALGFITMLYFLSTPFIIMCLTVFYVHLKSLPSPKEV